MSCQYPNRLEVMTNYVRGVLPDAEQETFEAHYLGCDECFRDLRFVEKAAAAMHYFGTGIFEPTTAKPKPVSPGWLKKAKIWVEEIALSQQWKRVVPALATYILLVATMSLGFYLITSNLNLTHHSFRAHSDRRGAMLPESSAQPNILARLEHLDWSISEATKTDTALFARLVAIQRIYQNHNYHQAVERLTQLASDFPNSIDAHLFLGISQLHTNKTAEGIQSLREVLQLDPENAAAQWYLVQGHLIQGDVDEARNLLVTLAERQDSQYGQQAAALLATIDKILVQKK
ncbi:MAG: tetratricopeptide repeat protein [candidate division KSB1 bacterium]|nr:tetratricopeptide repeat protein [candidate division KSB1 bacterium]MDZ7303302.1 tetratricopeptide repeat protein [candidate division KSB1 bacterium]MDZ7312604.1 tetratricopeptide repeat protein [candidate division KSB1 bacterium]